MHALCMMAVTMALVIGVASSGGGGRDDPRCMQRAMTCGYGVGVMRACKHARKGWGMWRGLN